MFERLQKLVGDNTLVTGSDYFQYCDNVRDNRDWQELVSHTIRDIEAIHQGKPIIGVGHSFGGSLLASVAVQRPDLFETLVIIDSPMVFSTAKRSLWHLANTLRPGIVEAKHPLIAPCLKKKDHWHTKENAIAYMETKALFNTMHPEVFDAFVQCGLEAHDTHNDRHRHHSSGTDTGVHLKIPKLTEANCYRMVMMMESFAFLKKKQQHPYDLPILPTRTGVNSNANKNTNKNTSTNEKDHNHKKQLSAYYWYSDKHAFLTPGDIKWGTKYFHNVSFVPFPHNHFWPLEDPDSFTAAVLDLVQK